MTDLISAAMGPGGGGHGGGGHGGGGEPEETASNNLSYPVIFTDGTALTLAGVPNEYTLTTPYDLNGDGVITAADQINGYYLFAQKVAANTWQADSLLLPADEDPATNLFVSTIDWGDSIEGGKPIAMGRPTRIEISFYKDLATPLAGDVALEPTMTSYPMQLLANPSSPTEVQGASAAAYPLSGVLPSTDVLTLESSEASVYAHTAKLALQYITGTPEVGDVLWNGDYWVDADLNDAVTIDGPIGGLTFGGEITVSGKVVYGLSMGGWRPDRAGTYRATVYFPETGNLQLDSAAILASTEESTETIMAAEGTGEEPPTDTSAGAQIDGLHNLTYLDLFVEGNQPPVVQPIVVEKTEDDPDFTISLISTAIDPEQDDLTVSNVVVVASDGTSPVTLPVGTTEVQGSNVVIRPSLLNALSSGQKVIIQASFSVSDGTNVVPSTSTITVDGRDESTSPPSGGDGGGSAGSGSVTPPSAGPSTPPITAESPKDPGNGDPPQGDPPSMIGTAGADRIHGTRADDRIIGGAGNDRLKGHKGRDTLFGEAGNDALFGNKGDDVLDGGAGDDVLWGGLGVDDLTGGAGADTFRLRLRQAQGRNNQPDRILDFDLSRDRLDLDSSISRQMLSFGDGLLMVQFRNQELVLAQLGNLNGLSGSELINQIQLV